MVCANFGRAQSFKAAEPGENCLWMKVQLNFPNLRLIYLLAVILYLIVQKYIKGNVSLSPDIKMHFPLAVLRTFIMELVS